MANIVSVKTLSENTHEIVVAFHLQYVDAGDESAVSKVDVSALATNSNGDSCTAVRLVECWWVIQGSTVEVMAAADTNVIMMHLAADDIGYQDFSKFGGLPSTLSYGANPTGDIKFTTTGVG